MVQQVSGSECRQGYSWGYDSSGIWVDRGCRANFEVGTAGFRPGGYGGNGNEQIVRCNSDDGDRHTCSVDTRGGVRLSRQISGSRCTEGYSWGYDRSGIWVDHGCRAEFAVRSGGGFGYGGGGGQYGNTITCSSDDGGRRVCPADTRRGVRLVRQISGSPCQQGSTWGYDSRGIWVDRGCRAEFATRSGGGYGGGGNAYGSTITCSSDDGKRRVCPADTHRGVRLSRQISGSRCQEGYSWGYDNNGVWVDRGCRAEFTLGGR